MSTTSSWRARRRAARLWLLLGAAPACAQAPAAERAAARPAALEGEGGESGARPAAHPMQRRPLSLRRARLRRLDPELSRLAGSRFQREAPDPVVIDVRLEAPLDGRPRDSAPLIELNGVPLLSTRQSPEAPDRLVAFLPERSPLRPKNEIRVVWSGSERATRSPEPASIPDEPEDD